MVVLSQENRVKLARSIFTLVCMALLAGCGKSKSEQQSVVLYTSQDQFYAEPILKEFTAKTGIQVRPVFDTESAKTAGLAHRLRAERDYPQCDVFWSNEEMHMHLLVRDHVIGSNDWRAAGYRTRRIVINTNHVSLTNAISLLSLTNANWSGHVALAYPLFGTTASQFLALREHWGADLWKRWCYGLVRNGAKIVDGNSVVVKLVGTGQAWVGLTDSDDIAAGKKQGFPIAELPLHSESVIIQSTLGLVRDAPNPANARILIDYLSKHETLQEMIKGNALEGVAPGDLARHTLQVDWDKALADYETFRNYLDLIFVRQ
jgi:iron(III) transport system substrate-binding protein